MRGGGNLAFNDGIKFRVAKKGDVGFKGNILGVGGGINHQDVGFGGGGVGD